VVEAGAAQRHEPHAESGQRPERRLVELVVDECADGLRALGEKRCFSGEPGLVVDEAVAGRGVRGVEEAPVVGLGAEDGDIHGSGRTARGRKVHCPAAATLQMQQGTCTRATHLGATLTP